ncbi:MAG: ABC transporter substrate-binding protein [Alphaproteobacteria bacterium]
MDRDPNRERSLKLLLHSAVLGAAAVVLLSGAPAVAQEKAKIGALVPMTGTLAAYGEPSLNAIKLAADHVNAGGGVLGGTLGVAVGDTQTVPQAGVDAANTLVSIEGVSGLVGALASGVTMPVAGSVSKVKRVPQISSASTSPAITMLDDDDFLFRTVPHDALQGIVLAEVVKSKAGFDHVSVIYINNDYGDGLQKAFGDAFVKLGGKVAKSLPYEEKKASYRGELAQLAKGKPRALVLIGYPEDGVPILRQSLEEGYFSKFIFPDGMKAPEIIEQVGAKHLNGSHGTAPEAVETDASRLFKKAYEAKYGELPPKPFLDTAYDAAFLLALAIEKAGSAEGKAVRDALRSVANPPGTAILPGEWAKAKGLLAKGEDIDYVGAAGSQNFDAAGDVPGTIGHWVIEDGKIKTVEILE